MENATKSPILKIDIACEKVFNSKKEKKNTYTSQSIKSKMTLPHLHSYNSFVKNLFLNESLVLAIDEFSKFLRSMM